MKRETMIRLIQRLLEDYAGELGNHGCNDMNLDDYGISREEQEELVHLIHKANGDPEEIPGSVARLPHNYDFSVVYGCSEWLSSLLPDGGES